MVCACIRFLYLLPRTTIARARAVRVGVVIMKCSNGVKIVYVISYWKRRYVMEIARYTRAHVSVMLYTRCLRVSRRETDEWKIYLLFRVFNVLECFLFVFKTTVVLLRYIKRLIGSRGYWYFKFVLKFDWFSIESIISRSGRPLLKKNLTFSRTLDRNMIENQRDFFNENR